MNKRLFTLVALVMTLLVTIESNSKVGNKASLYESVFAQINDVKISEAQLRQFIYQQTRNRFYHGKPKEGEEIVFYKEVGALLVERCLIAQAARDAKLKIDNGAIEKKLADYDKQFEGNEQWKIARVDFLPMYRQLLETETLAATYETYIRDSIKLSEQQVRGYHARNLEKFTQPPQNHVAVIMMNVSPSAGGLIWQAVQEQAYDIHSKLENGANFAALAELHSTDITADRGGDMGFIHQGLTAKKVENLLADLKLGEITKPVVLLDGIAIFKLLGRKPSIVHSFNEVAKRARILALADAQNGAWEKTKDKLNQKSKITINQSIFDN